ncbi:beta-xylosidase/alpha-L-arabinofuranosidase 1-like [Quercus lobata]|uniref:beta-xylosidase/alpha-L-arabinofuranosidase 1-like n=1 Tax=Quercus lobata TaxID=97700 RepID=UPI0012441145|nr:beta-xylosidase/alpha-L-arabinofuranosidase 1-like [Quercus lobata]
MARTLLTFLLCIYLTLAFCVIYTDARKRVTKIGRDTVTPGRSNFTYICDPARYAQLGLDIKSFPFCDKKLSYQVRARDLVSQMTLYEKVRQLGNRAYGAPRIGLPEYEWWSEALHGLSNVGPGTFFDDSVAHATSFPTPILTTASFNESLWNTIGKAVSTEARALYNLGHAGLTFWSPTINVARDPRWGRIIETPGEDPFVVGTYAANYVRGLQDVEGTEHFKDLNSRPLKVSACCKHFTAYDVDNWKGVERYSFDAKVTEQDLAETFNRPFQMCVENGDVSSVMCSYNRVNGIPACADPKLLKQTVREDWNLHGYIVADCDSIEVMIKNHKWLNVDNETAVSYTLQAGLDLDCGVYYTNNVENAVKHGKVREALVDRSLQYLYVVLMRLGIFDGHSQYNSLGINDVCSNEHIELAAEAAREGIVLLKNDNGILPLATGKYPSLAVVGPHANASTAMIGNYAFDPWNKGTPCRYITPLNGFSSYGRVNYAAGCSNVKCPDGSLIGPAVQVATTSDATIIVAGIDLSIEAESRDRLDLFLPGKQTDLINQVANASKGPVVLVIMSAGGVDISFAKNNPKIHAILWSGYPGEEGGQAIADIIFGKYNPGGRLPVTWYQADYVDKLPLTSMQLRPDDSNGYPGRTYKFFDGPTVFPFGYGLSYTKFNYTLKAATNRLQIKLTKFQHCRDLPYKNGTFKPSCPAIAIDDLRCNKKFKLAVEVKNVGNRDGDEVVLVYSQPPVGIVGTHIKNLIAFQKVFVAAGTSKTIQFAINTCQGLGIVDSYGNALLPSGAHTIIVGDGAIVFPIQLTYR